MTEVGLASQGRCSGTLFGDEQRKDKLHGSPVRRLERQRLSQTHEGATGLLESLDPSVGNGNSLSETGRAELFSGKQAVEDRAAGNSVGILEEQADVLEQALLAGDLDVEQDVVFGEQAGE